MTPPTPLKPESWWSWNADLPAEMRHLSSEFILTPVLYAASENRPSHLPPGEGVVFGPRAIGDEEIQLALSLAGTRLDWRYGLDRAGGLSLDWRTQAFGEWGLRFWVLLCVHGGPEAYFRYNRATGELEGRSGGRRLKLQAAKAPLLVTAHEDLAALEAELLDKGYFYLGSRAVEGGFLALRFNLEEAPEMRVAVSVDGAQAPEPQESEPEETSELQGALQAVHDVVSWNHVYDFVNGRPYTGLSRFWNSRKFGGFGVWLDDILFNAWLWGHFETARAWDNLEAVFAWQTEAGNFPCLVTGNDAWLDRSQPPIGAFVVWTLFARSGDRGLLERAYPGLLRNYYWWWARRSLGDTGLLAYGTSLDAGDGLYKGTKLAAKDESTMDNSPLHDPAPFDETTGLLLAADVGLNSLAALDGEVLGQMARTLGQDAEADELESRVTAHKARIAEWLWDETRQVFANRLLDGGFVTPLAPTSFYPLAAGIGSPEQQAALVERYLHPEDKFGGAFGLPSVTRDDPAYGDNVYWRGRIWGPLNFWAYQGLRRAGLDGEAAALAEKSLRLFAGGWQARECGENYNAETGAIRDQPDTDGFYSWGALLPALAASEHLDMTPWAGWSVMGPPAGTRLGPLLTPAGRAYLCAEDESWRLEREDGRVLLASNLTGRLCHLSLEGAQPEVLLPAIEQDDAWIAFPAHESAACDIAGEKVRRRDGRFALPRSDDPVRLRGLATRA
jgi:putative isomerase